MPNSLLQIFRTDNPNDTRSDEQLTFLIGSKLDADTLAHFPDFATDYQKITREMRMSNAGTLWQETKRDVAGGVDQFQGQLYDTAALAGDTLGIGPLSRWGQAGFERNQQEAAQNQPTIPSYTDVQGWGDVPRYLLGVGAQQLPQIAGTVGAAAVGAGVGALIGGPAGAAAGAEMTVERALAAKAAQAAAARLGGKIAGFGMSFTQNENRGALREMPGADQSGVVPSAIASGLLGALVETELPGTVLKKLTDKMVPLKVLSPALAHVPDEVAATYFSRVLKEIPVSILSNASEEVLQELPQIAGEDYVNRNNPDFKRAPGEIRDRLINVGVAGGVLGAPFGLVPGGHGQQQVQQTAQQDTARARAAAAAVAPLVPPVQSVLGGVSTDNDGLDEEIDYEVDPLAAMRTAAANFGVEEEVVPAAPVPVQAQPVAAVPVGDQQIRDDLKLQGVKDPDIDALILGTKTPAQVVEENLASVGYVGLATAGQNQGHADAFEAGFNQAVNNIADILNGDRPSGDTRRRQSLPVEAAAVPSVPVEQPAVVPVAASVAVAQPEAAIVPAAVVPPPVVEPIIPVAPAPVPVAEAPAAVVPTQPELVPRQTKELPLEQVDFKRATLPGATIQKAGTETDNPVWRAWKQSEKNDSNADAVGAELERGGSADPKNKSVTRRVAFFQDQGNNGEIVGVPIYNLRGDKGYHVGNPEGDGGGALKTLLAKQFDGKQRFIPIGSALLSDGVKGREGEYRWRYKDAQHFLNSFLAPAAKMVAAQSGETGKNLDAFERMTNPNAQTEVDPESFHGLFLDSVGNFSGPITVEHIAGAVRGVMQDLEGIRSALNALDLVMTPDESERFGKLGDKEQYEYTAVVLIGSLFDTLKGSRSVAEIAQRLSSSDGPVQAGNVAARSGADTGRPASESADPTVFSQPGPGSEREAQKASSPAIESRFNNLVERLTDFGISYQALADSEELSGNIGAFSPSKNAITLVLADAENPTRGNLAVLLEEIGHAIVKDMPDDLRSAVLRAIAAVSDEKIGLDPTHDARLLNGTMPAGVLTEERLVKAMAQRGVNAPVARGIAANIVRFLKDLYFRAAIAMQRAFGRDPSASLAMAYMENRLRGFEGGTAFLMPLTGAVVPRIYTQADDRFSGPSITDEKIGVRDNPQMIPETQIAAINEANEFWKSLDSRLRSEPSVAAAAKDAGVSALDWARQIFRLPDYEALKQEQTARLGPPGVALPINPNIRITDFKATQNTALANLKAYEMIQQAYAKIEGRLPDLGQRLADQTALRDRAKAKFDAATLDYTNVKGLTATMLADFKSMYRRLFKDIAKTSSNLGAISQQLLGLSVPLDSLRDYRALFQAMDTQGEKLFTLLDTMATDDKIDFTQTIASIKAAMVASGNPEYAALTNGTKEANALLATLVATAKRNEMVMLALELKWLGHGGNDAGLERRAKINDMLKTLSTEAESSMMPGGTTTVSLGDLPRTAAIEDRLKVAFTKEKARLGVYNRSIAKVQTEIAAGRAVADQFRAKMWQMAGLNEIRPPVVIKDGAVFDMPKTNSPSQLGDFKSVTLRLSTTNSSVANMDEMTAAVGAMTEMLDEFDKTGRRDGFYYRIKAQRDFLTHHFVTDDIRQTDNTIFGLGLSTLGKQIGAIGTPTARLIEAGNNKVASKEKELHGQGVKLGLAVERHRIAAANALKIELAHYMRNYYDFGGDFLKRQRTIVEKYPNDPQRAFDQSFIYLQHYIETDTSQREKAAWIFRSGGADVFWSEYKKHLASEIASSQHWEETTSGIGYGAVDDRAKVEVERGKFAPGYRARIERGTMTVPQTLSKGVVSPMFAAMAQANWQGLDVSRIAELYNSGDLAALDAALQKYFSAPEIQDSFFRGIAELPTFSPFMAPALSTDPNTIPEANPALVKAAFDASGGNITNFIVQMYQMHRGTPGLGPDFGAYAQGIMGVFNDYFHQLLANRQSFNPEEMGKSPKDWSTMIQPFMLTARQSENMPASWLELVSFDLMQNQRIGQRVAATFGFGPNQENLAEWHATVAKEVGEAATKLLAASTWVEANEPSTDPKIREAALVNRVGSKTELARLRRMTDLAKFVPQFQDQMIQIYRGKNSVTRPARFLHQLINLFAGWMVNQPSSSLSQLSEGFSPLFAYGASPLTIKSTLRIAYRTGSILAESLANAVGIAFKHQDAAYQRFMDTGKGDPGAFLKLTDAMLPVETRYDDDASFSGKALRKMSRGVHVLRGFTQQGLNFVGDRAGAATFRPLAPFLTMSNAIQAACTIELGRTADDLVSKGIEAQTKLGVTFKPGEDLGAIAEKLGYKGGDKSTFVRLFTFARDGYGLDYATLVKEGERNQSKGKDRLSERTLGLLQGLGIKETTSESNIATMNSHFLTDSILRASMPLLSWSFRRAGKVASLRYDAENKASTAATLRGVLALAALAGGGLAVSALMDVYNDELLKKRRNLRRLSLDGGGTNLAMAVLEHSTRIGTFGFFGELANSAVNVGTGGDNRGISLDNRIVFMNSAIGFTRAMSAFLNQDFTADWANVVRPTLQSLGGGGALQYMQLANRLFGADNAESEMVARSNMSNWLRVVGREQGMEVRPFTGGYNSPTPMTPYVTRMQLAAFGNDPQTFSSAYRDAIRQAQIEGKPDPAKYVEESFSSRNPLKTVFRTAPSEAEYHKILMALPPDGRDAVVQGMALINRYGATIGVRPWEGKVERAPGGNVRQNASPFSTSLGGVRDRAAMFGNQFAF